MGMVIHSQPPSQPPLQKTQSEIRGSLQDLTSDNSCVLPSGPTQASSYLSYVPRLTTQPATPPTEEERGDSSRPSSQSNVVQTSQAIVVEGEEAYRLSIYYKYHQSFSSMCVI